ncbi:metallophosphoesterase family protein [Haladaptatus halobius]|jgi:putative phosphoesterase|uniref:metallophosphoesterase family protein n=1 Tax=Haladaptatus halobius TaxID=2884875 RepID=UPI001D09B255|nr:metallophosphoesterase family protein [Haladaptatus halobius]
MKVGVISDVHANRVALDAVLDDMPPVDALLCAGDVVGYNPWPAECVEVLRDRVTVSVMGNHDRAVVSDTTFGFNSMASAGVEYARDELNDLQREWLANRPASAKACSERVRIVHGHPDDPDHYTYPEEFGPELLGDEDALVMGHTHVQHHESYDEGVVLNPGSVGQPRDRDPRAAYAILDLSSLAVEEHRVEYDVEVVQEAVREAGLPDRIGARLADGR